MKILVVEDSRMDQKIIESSLSDHELIIVDSGEAGLDEAKNRPDLILLDINLPGLDGYEICKTLRSMDETRHVPVIFLTSLTTLEDRIKAFDVGGDDHISKPCDPSILRSKVDIYFKQLLQLNESRNEAQSAFSALMDVQKQSSNVQSVSRFVQASLFCHDIDSLFRLFINTATEIGANCVLKIESKSESMTQSTNGSVSLLEKEILEYSDNVERIHQFGQDRAIFKWPHATLLTLKVGDLIDVLAIFMDALEAGINSIETEALLLSKVKRLEEENSIVRDRISDVFSQMSEELKQMIMSLGLISALDPNEEDNFNDMVEQYSQLIRKELADLENNNEEIQLLVSELRTPPSEIKMILDNQSGSVNTGVELF